MDHYDVLDEDLDDIDKRRRRGPSYNYYNDYTGRDYYNNMEDHHPSKGFARLWRWWTDDDSHIFYNSSRSSNVQWTIVVALVVVCVFQFQFQSTVWAIWYRIRQDGVLTTVVDLFFSFLDLIRAYFQIAVELVRSLRHNTPLSFFFDMLLGGGNGGFVDDYERPPASTRRRTGFFSVGSPPPLVIVSPDGVIEESQNSSDRRSPSPASSFSSQSTTEHGIEPAFLNEEDYPPGWLVYHAELGVVAKEEADAYDAMLRRRQKKRQQGNEQGDDEKTIAVSDGVEPTLEAGALPTAVGLEAKQRGDSPPLKHKVLTQSSNKKPEPELSTPT